MDNDDFKSGDVVNCSYPNKQLPSTIKTIDAVWKGGKKFGSGVGVLIDGTWIDSNWIEPISLPKS